MPSFKEILDSIKEGMKESLKNNPKAENTEELEEWASDRIKITNKEAKNDETS